MDSLASFICTPKYFTLFLKKAFKNENGPKNCKVLLKDAKKMIKAFYNRVTLCSRFSGLFKYLEQSNYKG